MQSGLGFIGNTFNGNYHYDGNLKRVKSIINGQVIYNIYDASGALVLIDKATEGQLTAYVKGPMGTLARIANTVIQSTGTLSNDKVTYLHTDHLGSAQSGTKGSGYAPSVRGDIQWREQYTPFGEQILNPAANDNLDGFTGHIRDKATGLNYMQARYYDPVIGRFLSIDPVTFLDTGNPSSFNRYSYVSNNPVKFIDPDGRYQFDPSSNNMVSTQGEILYAAHEAITKPAWDFFTEDIISGAKALASGDIKGAAGSAVLATLKPAKVGNKLRKAVGCCFVEGTLVETEFGPRPIEDIKVGDRVLSRNPETGETAYKEVTAFIPRHDRIIWTVTLSGANDSSESFETTDEHPWWVINESGVGSWKQTDELTARMIVTTADNQTMTITSALETERLDGTYNITVADFETYFVGKNRVLVHNCGGKKPPNLSPDGAGRKGAFREAKRHNNVPTSQQPKVSPNVDRRGNTQPGRQYEFTNNQGEKVTIRDDVAGHKYPDDPSQNRGSHFNDDSGNHFDYD